MTPEEFFHQLVTRVVAGVVAGTAQSPPKVVEVKRIKQDGTTGSQQTTLQQLLAELTDQLKISNALTMKSLELITENMKVSADLIDELEANREVCEKALRKNKKRERDDDED